MASVPNDPHNEAHGQAVADAKRLMRLARTGALATLEAAGGAPLTTLVGVASDFDGAPLFLMSTLSRHMRNLAHDPRASLLLTGRLRARRPAQSSALNPQRRDRTAPGRPGQAAVFAAQSQGRALRRLRRFRRLRPPGRGRAFQRRLRPRRAALSGGGSEPPRGRSGARRGRGASPRRGQRARRARRSRGSPGREPPRPVWRAIGLDAEGLDLAAGARAARAQFITPAHDPEAWRARLEQLLAAG